MASIRLAIETMRRIDGMIQADQGSAYRGLLGKIMPNMADAYRTGEEGHRSHLGASVLGEECARALWYGFHWVTKPLFDGRILRLFNRGHMEEGRFIAMFLMIGCPVYQYDTEGKQYRIVFANGHGGGSGDGVGLGSPDLPADLYFVLEFKTHGEKSFIELAGKNWRKFYENLFQPGKHKADRNWNGQFDGKGVRDAKFSHYVQMQAYMRKMGITVAIYGAINKNTDDLYLEIITLDPETADVFIDRGEKIIYMETPPPKLSTSPGFFKCMFCDHKPVCHLGAEPDRNCRTCESARAMPDGTWTCLRFDETIPKEVQLTGCPHYNRNPVI